MCRCPRLVIRLRHPTIAGGTLTVAIFALTLALGFRNIGTTTNTNNDNNNNNNIKVWRGVTADEGFTPRDGHAAVGLNNDLIIIAGHFGAVETNEVLRSSDNGRTWTSMAFGIASSRFLA
ncbi:hypothetical protein P0082_00710 [Candidatus Haliotispira prima]|uniref:Exo-alpha-sialidase n=1 Tax=Candidatus Haliotispira prima TaxID=3034016 RepID=A0ABY8MHB6_9SPIO|nr:hypothetical protein P0082_00710 [Candidatus Haliotispira prima]